jgi:magnesium-transporting ATPase (P-type)
MQLAQALNSRALSRSLFSQPLFNNPHLIVGIFISFGLLVACMYIPGWNKVFDQFPMDGYDWIITFSFVVCHVCVIEGLKYGFRHNFFLSEPPADPMKIQWYTG